jgi:hypothetical protein
MFIVFGWVKKGKRERPLLDTYCYQCKRQTTWDWFRLTDWLSIFFIELVPVKDDHLLACQGCGDQLPLTKNEARGIKRLKQLSDSESKQLHDALVQRLEDHQLDGKTATQREFLKSKRPD